MKRNKLISLNIRLGLAGEFTLSSERTNFHEKIVRMVYPNKKDVKRIGLDHTSPFDYSRMRLETGYVSNIVTSALAESLVNAKSIDIFLIDLSNNPFGLLRDPILIQLSDVLAQLSGTGICSTFILLLPELPSPEAASMQQFMANAEKHPSAKLVVIANDGDSLWLPKTGKVSSLKPRYLKHLQSLEINAGQRFANKIVKRLGHFRRAKHGRGCRVYSYTADNCEEELLQLLQEWWRRATPKPQAILYDTHSNESLTRAIKALCTRKKVQFHRVDDIFMIPGEAQKAAGYRSTALVVDVVETGTTISKQITQLKEMHISLNGEIIAAIAKGSVRQKLGEFRITSFASAEAEPDSEGCIQCQLGLPFTSDDVESFATLRSYDMWFMAHKVGWEPERDVPENVGEGYEIVPRFKEMLIAHGDWIAYKMEKFYKSLSYPENIFVIHPDEEAANEVSKNLRLRFDGKLTIVKVPRKAIKAAQAAKNLWEPVIAKTGRNVDWVEQLISLSNARALITDIFNASGSTFESLNALLKVFGIQVFCYFPFVDRDFGRESAAKYGVTRYALYRWYGPRHLRNK